MFRVDDRLTITDQQSSIIACASFNKNSRDQKSKETTQKQSITYCMKRSTLLTSRRLYDKLLTYTLVHQRRNMRINYAPSTPPTTNPDGTPLPEAEQKATAEVYERVAARRKPRPLIPLDLALLHSPPIANGYNALLGAIRTEAVMPQDILELSVCRVAILNGAVYEWNAHAPLALKAGVTAAQLQEVKSLPISTFTPEGKIINNVEKPAGSSLTDFQWETVIFTDAMTKNIKVDDAIFAAIKSRFSEREVVELTVCIGAYNMVSRFLVTLDVGENNDKSMKDPVDIEAELKR